MNSYIENDENNMVDQPIYVSSNNTSNIATSAASAASAVSASSTPEIAGIDKY